MAKQIILSIFTFVLSGCALLPTASVTTTSPWNSHNDISKSYNEIKSFKTTKKDLHQLGFNPYTTPNIKILNYLDITERFLVTPSIQLEHLDASIQKCLKNQKTCMAYEMQIKHTQNERYGSLFLDLFNFRKNTLTTGWSFYSLVVLENDTVIYKVKNSIPNINTKEEIHTPLGPFQNMESVAVDKVID
jgi:hypothetical protein